MTAARSRLRLLSAVALVATVAGACAKTGAEPTATPPEEPPATARDGAPVFPVPADAEAAIAKAGLPIIEADEPRPVRFQAHLDVLIDGKAVTVPKGIGVVDEKRSSPLYTTDDTGVLHVASPRPETFRLGHLFQQWNVPLDKDCIARFCLEANPEKQLLAFVDGELAADPSTVHLTDGAQIVVWYGNRGVNPGVPASYPFPD